MKTDQPIYNLQENLQKKYTFHNNPSKMITIISIIELIYITHQNMVKYCQNYYAIKTNIKEQNMIIKNKLKIQIFKNLNPAFKMDLIVVNHVQKKTSSQK